MITERKVFIVWDERLTAGVVFAGDDAERNAMLALKGEHFECCSTVAFDFEAGHRAERRTLQTVRLRTPLEGEGHG